MNQNLHHESARGHVTGEARYVDDLPEPEQLLVGRVVYSSHAHARIRSFDLTAAKAIPGVAAVLSAKDIPGRNQMGPVIKDEPVLATEVVHSVGQALFLIAAETDEQCREAERQIRVAYEPLEAILTLPEAMARNALLGPPRKIERGDAVSAIRNAPLNLRGELETGAQEHWYLETQACLCVPDESDRMRVFSSTQHPSETQTLVAEVLGWPRNAVTVDVRRLGGAFGGKETQANHTACWTALLSHATGRPVKIRLFRDDDMIMTGKRHRFLIRYEAGFDREGMLHGMALELHSDGGAATDLSFAILERAMLHVDNSYFVPACSVTGYVWKTNLPSNTAFRGFGGPQGMAAIETIMDRIARTLQQDPAEIRRRNFYGSSERNTTHYGQRVENNRLQLIFDRITASSDYFRRRRDIQEFNAQHEFEKRGIALTPVKFGISFTTTHLNQAAALVNIYTDGTVLVHHGGVEMGQGLQTKIQGIAAVELGIDPACVRTGDTSTGTIPNTSATAASSGADMNGMAVKRAVDALKSRMADGIARHFSCLNLGDPSAPEDIRFSDGCVTDAKHPDRSLSFKECAQVLHLQRISLSAEGYYSTPEIGWDRQKGRGRPFLYYAFGMAVSEVLVDLLTGDHTILRADILHDAGDSLNPGIDIGQVEGGFLQGIGWCTMEQIAWDEQGRLLTHSPDTYKIPTAGDVPADFRVELLSGVPNPDTIHRSKAVGEPPFMLAFSVWLAIKDALSATAQHRVEPEFSLPATRERILLAAESLRTLHARPVMV
ncbi:MAG: xanthine dehydrogenase molybdopterin binding subunit [Bacteroidetes bacterium]|nr:xanthine dehydrogenase molybdopterin binding subunit [Bacteroidota bacterium]